MRKTDLNGVPWYDRGTWVEEAAATPWVGPFDPGDERDTERKVDVMESVFDIIAGRDEAAALIAGRPGRESEVRMIGLEELVTRF